MGFVASHLVHRQLLAIRKACEITHTEPKVVVKNEKEEDGTVFLPFETS